MFVSPRTDGLREAPLVEVTTEVTISVQILHEEKMSQQKLQIEKCIFTFSFS